MINIIEGKVNVVKLFGKNKVENRNGEGRVGTVYIKRGSGTEKRHFLEHQGHLNLSRH